MVDLYIKKINNVYLEIECENATASELNVYFSFEIPNKHFNPLVKARRWDGIIKLFNKKNHLIYGGLLKYIVNFAQERNYTIKFEDSIITLHNISLKECEEHILSLNIHSNGKPISVRDYQIKGITKALRYKRGVILAPTSSGKSVLLYGYIRYFLEKQLKKILVIVPTISLTHQLYTDFEDYSSANGWKVEDNIHIIHEGMSLESEKSIFVSTWQSIVDQPEEWFEQFDGVIIDECHGAKSQSFKTILSKCINAEYRLGVTGTLDGVEIHQLVIEGLLGPVVRLTTTKDLQDKGWVSPLIMKCITLKHPEQISRQLMHHVKFVDAKTSYFREVDILDNCVSRNEFITNLALSLKNNSLILFEHIKQGELLRDLLKNKSEKDIYFISGQSEVEEREEVRAILERENGAIILASRVFNTGINIKNLHNLILASPTKSRIKTLQSIGRTLRLHENKEFAIIYDISDDFRIDKFVNFTLKHFDERLKIYRDEHFDVKQYLVDLNY